MTTPEPTFNLADQVAKVGGDYTFVGVIVAAFPKLSGVRRYVVEDDRGVLHVYSGRMLRLVEAGGPRTWAMPAEPDPDVIRVRDVYGQCFERGDAINDDGSTEPVWLGDAFTDEADVPDFYLSWKQLMKEHSPLTEVVSDVA